jgi:hypothetical protein
MGKEVRQANNKPFMHAFAVVIRFHAHAPKVSEDPLALMGNEQVRCCCNTGNTLRLRG